MNILASIKQHLFKILVGILVVSSIVVGYFCWQAYQYYKSPECLADQVQEALKPGQIAKLAAIADFGPIFTRLSSAIATSYPFIESGENQQERITRRVQIALLEKFRDTSKPAADHETDKEKILLRPLKVLPPDFVEQLSKSMHLQRVSEYMAVLTFTVRHPQLNNQAFQLAFTVSNTPDGWRITDFSNASQVVAAFRAAHLQRQEAKRQIYVRRNQAAADTMRNLLTLESCSASTGMISDGRTVLTVVHVLARNKSSQRVENVNLLVSLQTPDGKELLSRNLNAAQATDPGADFDHRWTIDMDRTDPEAQALLASPSLVCKPRWYSMALDNGRILYDVEVLSIPEDIK